MTHTPTPWKAYTQKGGWNIHGPDCMIAQVLFDPVLLEETCKVHRANARHIVKCVNAHEELVAALKFIASQPGKAGNWAVEIAKQALNTIEKGR